MSTLRADFDRLALVAHQHWDHNNHYHSFLLRHLPSRCAHALEIGCGTGEFARLLAERCENVVALDLSPEMVRVATERSRGRTNIDFRVGDVLDCRFPAAHFDCIASIATLHHLPLNIMLTKMRDALKPGGVVLILDLFKSEGWADRLDNIVAFPSHVALMLIRNHRLREPRPVREAWAMHAPHDTYLRLSQIRELCGSIMPGAQVRRHLLWRYSIVWRKPAIANTWVEHVGVVNGPHLPA